MWALYVVAKVAELSDGTIFEWSGFWSGHTVKHLVAAAASYVPALQAFSTARSDPAVIWGYDLTLGVRSLREAEQCQLKTD